MTKPIVEHIQVTSEPKQAWTQGIGSDGESNGDFKSNEFECELHRAVKIVSAMPMCPKVPEKERYCPPAFGFGNVNICRLESGQFFSWPDKRWMSSCEEAINWLAANWGTT